MSITAKELQDLIESIDNYDVSWDEIDGYDIPGFSERPKVVDRYGGEGQGDTLYVVFELEGRYFKFDGYYSSYDGYSWDDGHLYEVEPFEKTVTDYRPI
jgi:hypothetical protein